jgi:hypothetical protein
MPVYICVFQIYLRGEGWGEGSFKKFNPKIMRKERIKWLKLIIYRKII